MAAFLFQWQSPVPHMDHLFPKFYNSFYLAFKKIFSNSYLKDQRLKVKVKEKTGIVIRNVK